MKKKTKKTKKKKKKKKTKSNSSATTTSAAEEPLPPNAGASAKETSAQQPPASGGEKAAQQAVPMQIEGNLASQGVRGYMPFAGKNVAAGVDAYLTMADRLLAQGGESNLTDAMGKIAKAAKLCERKLGPDHPLTRKVQENHAAVIDAVVRLHLEQDDTDEDGDGAPPDPSLCVSCGEQPAVRDCEHCGRAGGRHPAQHQDLRHNHGAGGGAPCGRRFCGDEQCMEFCLWANYAQQTKSDMVLAEEERKAAGGDADAARRLYTVFMQGLPGECVGVDKPRAMRWLRKAAGLGDMNAQV
jgi:TPR repeat protein